MAFGTMAASAAAAVKNGPAGMWRALGSPASAAPIGRFTTSPLWLVATTCGYLALAVFVARRTRRATAPPGRALAIITAVLGPLVVAQLLARSAALGLLVLVLMVSVWVAVLVQAALPARRHTRGPAEHGPAKRGPARRSPDERRPAERGSARHTSAQVVDLARWRSARGTTRRHRGSRQP